MGRIIDLYDSWMETLPNVNPYYAVKCNSDPMLLKVLASLGVGFDCASKVRKERIDSCMSIQKLL